MSPIEPVIKACLRGRRVSGPRLVQELGLDHEQVYEALVSMEARRVTTLIKHCPHARSSTFKWALGPQVGE